jgi:hypothetical protein
MENDMKRNLFLLDMLLSRVKAQCVASSASEGDLRINVSHLPATVYFIKIGAKV